MNLPNKLTVLRVIMVPFFVFFIAMEPSVRLDYLFEKNVLNKKMYRKERIYIGVPFHRSRTYLFKKQRVFF